MIAVAVNRDARRHERESQIVSWSSLVFALMGVWHILGWMFQGFPSIVLITPMVAILLAAAASYLKPRRRWVWITAVAISLISVGAMTVTMTALLN